MEFQFGDLVLLKVSTWKGVIRFKKEGVELGPRLIGTFQVIVRVGKVAYKLDLSSELSQIYNTFHVSQLWKGVLDSEVVVPLDDIHVDEHLIYVERLMAFFVR